MESAAQRLRSLMAQPGLRLMPCCYDALTARLVEQAGFPLSFMSGFGVSACRLGKPDTGLISYGEMVAQGHSICEAVRIPVIGDGDTGYGNAMNVKRTVKGYAAAGFAGVMIEDQKAPKRCGHTRGKQVVSQSEALLRLQAAVDARDGGADIVIVARTDARAVHGMDEALERMKRFAEIGADILFLEAPCSEEEMWQFCEEIPGHKMANMIEQGNTPWLSPFQLEKIGFKLAVYPLTLLSTGIRAMQLALESLKSGRQPSAMLSFEELQAVVGFPEYDQEARRYRDAKLIPDGSE